MIPDGWQRHLIGAICESIVPGRNKPKSFDGDIPWVTTPEIKGRYLPSKVQKNYISEEEIKKSGGKKIPAGCVVMAAVGDLGLIAIAKEPVVLNQQLHAFVCPKNVSNEFIAYFLSSQKNYMNSIASKTTIPYMNKANCESIPILLPAYTEQVRIAEILSTWDQAIEATEKLIANSEAQKKALMQQLLTGKKRLPGFEGEWTSVSLKDVGETSSGGTPESSNAGYWNGNIAWATPTDITALSSRYISNTARYISDSGLANSSAKLLPSNSLIICTRATVGKSAISTRPITTNQGFKNIIPNSNYDVHFLYYLLNYFQHKMIRAACGSTFLELSKSDFDKLSFKIPSIQEQIEIGSILSVMDNELESISETLGQLKSEKSALMQQLLTGKRRVAINQEEAA